MSNKPCPSCSKSLSLRQINFDTAVYICDDLNCKYPFGYECIEVKRTIEELKSDLKTEEASKKDSNKDDVKEWMDDVLTGEVTSKAGTSTSPSNQRGNEDKIVVTQEDPSDDKDVDYSTMDYNDLLHFLDSALIMFFCPFVSVLVATTQAMVVTIMWSSFSWLILTIFISTLSICAAILICLICLRKNRQQSSTFHTISTSTNNKFRGMIGISKLRKFKGNNDREASYKCVTNDLLDSTDNLNEFETSSLQLEAPQLDDAMSCYSTDSKHTYFSTYPGLVRSISSNSNASTFKSTKNLSRSSSLFSVKIDLVM